MLGSTFPPSKVLLVWLLVGDGPESQWTTCTPNLRSGFQEPLKVCTYPVHVLTGGKVMRMNRKWKTNRKHHGRLRKRPWKETLIGCLLCLQYHFPSSSLLQPGGHSYVFFRFWLRYHLLWKSFSPVWIKYCHVLWYSFSFPHLITYVQVSICSIISYQNSWGQILFSWSPLYLWVLP